MDDLNDWELQTAFNGPLFIHTSYQADWEHGIRRKEIVKVWQDEGNLGRGAFGHVSLQKQVTGGNGKRAVKKLYKAGMGGFDYKKELVALMHFSKTKVRSQFAVYPSPVYLTMFSSLLKSNFSSSFSDGSKMMSRYSLLWNTFHWVL